MLDFTSALYLGFGHASWSLPGWARLTLGKPAVLEVLPGVCEVQRELAALTGCERVVLGSSTLHLFGDLFTLLARRNVASRKVAIWIDDATYPIARWGAERAAIAGVSVRRFPHHDVAALENALFRAGAVRPVIVTDGFCPARGTPAPLPDYARCAASGNGLLVVDDTQALGMLGIAGGGSIRRFGLRHPGIVVVSSLAKAFGAPLAMLGGSGGFVEAFRRSSATFEHCSPPSAASVSAAQRALHLNRCVGDALRRRLAERVVRFRRGLRGLLATHGLFPVQTMHLPAGIDAREFYRSLLGHGVRCVLQRDSAEGGARIAFVLTARHRMSEIDSAVAIVRVALARTACRNVTKIKGAKK